MMFRRMRVNFESGSIRVVYFDIFLNMENNQHFNFNVYSFGEGEGVIESAFAFCANR